MGNNCQCADAHLRVTKIPKCSLFHKELLSEFELADKQNFHHSLDSSRCADSDPSKLPPKFIDLYLILKGCLQKYCDMYFPAEPWAITTDPAHQTLSQNWIRISQSSEQVCDKQENGKMSNFYSAMIFLRRNYPLFFEKIKPVYISSLGFAVCQLYPCGRRCDVIVDDRIPESKFVSKSSHEILLLEKAFAKVLGSYSYIDNFQVGEIFSQVCGIPFQIKNSDRVEDKNSFHSFKDALKCDQILYQSNRFKDNNFILGYRENFMITSISISGSLNLVKIQNPTKQSVSLRAVQENCKYYESMPLLEQYPSAFVQLFSERQKHIIKAVSYLRLSNCLYLGSSFIELSEGTHYIYVRQFEGRKNLNLIAYSKTTLKMSEIYEEKFIQSIPLKYLQTRFPQNMRQKQLLSEGVHAFMNFEDNKKLILFFDCNYPKKSLSIIYLNAVIEVESEVGGKKMKIISLQNVKDKWVRILLCFKSSEEEKKFTEASGGWKSVFQISNQ